MKKDIKIDKCDLSVEDSKLILSFTTYDNAPVRIAIDNQDTFICKNESTNTISFDITADSSETVDDTVEYYVENHEIDLKEVPLKLNSDLLFIFIFSSDDVEGEYLEAVVPVYSEYFIYKLVYDSIRSDFKDCNTSCSTYTGSANSIILFNGIEYSIAVGNYQRASDFWKLLHKTSVNNNNCNCGK